MLKQLFRRGSQNVLLTGVKRVVFLWVYFLDKKGVFTHFKASTSAVCPSGRMHRRTFPDLERGGGGGVSADSKSLVVKHKYSLGQITKKKKKNQQKIMKLNFVRRYRMEQNVALIDQ